MMDAVAAAARARGPQPLWSIVPPSARARFLRRAAQAVLEELDGLAGLLAERAGVPRTEAVLAELLPSAGGLRGLAGDGPRALAERRLGRLPMLRAGRRSVLLHAPAGVVAVRAGTASPWAEPLLELAAALLGGNGVVLAPSVPEVGERMLAVLGRTGLPDDLVVAVPPETPAAQLRAACDRVVETEPPVPKATMLVLDGAPVERTVAGALWAAFGRSGAGPSAVGRMVVVRSAAAAVLDELVAEARRLRVGDPRDPRTEVGPLRPPGAAERLAELLDDALAGGSTLVCGGRKSDGTFAPAVLRGVAPEARLLHEPVPGPVLAVVEAGDEADGLALAAAGRPAAVSVWSGDRAHGERVARALDAERIWVNDHGVASPAAPVRLARHVQPRQLGSQPAELRSARWLPYDPVLVRAAVAAARLQHGRESERLAALRAGAVPLVRVAARLGREALRGR